MTRRRGFDLFQGDRKPGPAPDVGQVQGLAPEAAKPKPEKVPSLEPARANPEGARKSGEISEAMNNDPPEHLGQERGNLFLMPPDVPLPPEDPEAPASLALVVYEDDTGHSEVYADRAQLLAYRPEGCRLGGARVRCVHPHAAPGAGRRLVVENNWASPSSWCRWTAQAVEVLNNTPEPQREALNDETE